MSPQQAEESHVEKPLAIVESSAIPEPSAVPQLQRIDHPKSLPTELCSVDAWFIAQKYNLSEKFNFSRRFVRASSVPREADLANRYGHFDPQPRSLSDSLVSGWDTVIADYSDKPVVGLSSCAPEQTVTVPVFAHLPETKTKGANLMVGYATTAERIKKRMLSLQHAFAHTQVHLVLQFPSAERDERGDARLGERMNDLGIRTTIIYDFREYRTRWSSMPKTLRLLADKDTKWLMISDDDSFIVSLPRLLTMLDKYDSRQFYFIGALTDKWQNTKFGAMSFGGSGTFLSLPLVDHLMPYWDDCAAIEKYGGGDQRLTYCIYKNSWTRMTWEQTILNQNDAEGDLQGLFESGQRFGTFHHISWRVRQHDEDLLARAADACGSGRTECLFQRFLSDCSTGGGCSHDTDSRLLLTNGWSIVRYPTARLPDFGRTEYTWDHEDWDFWSHAMGPLRPKVAELGRQDRNFDPLQTAWKETWLLNDVSASSIRGLSTNAASHVFIKRAEREGDIDSVIEIIWR